MAPTSRCPTGVADPYWDAELRACTTELAEPTCAPTNLGFASSPSGAPCTTHGQCSDVEFCGAGYCRSAADELVTVCVEGAQVLGPASGVTASPSLWVNWGSTGIDDSTYLGHDIRTPPSEPGCVASWETCALWPFEALHRSVAFLYQEGQPKQVPPWVSYLHFEVDRSIVDAGCVSLAPVPEISRDGDAVIHLSVWYP